jgi:hypothetical protein
MEKPVFKLYDEEFACVPSIQGKVLLQFAASSDSDNASESSAAITGFFEKVLVEESYVRFQKLLDDPEKIVSVTTLSEIIGWVLEEYSNRPAQVSKD